jgi:cytochrome P450
MALDRSTAKDMPATVAAPPKPLGFWRSYRAARRNVLEMIPEPAYREPIVAGGRRAGWIMVMDPPWLEHVLRVREVSYPRSAATIRILKPREGDSLFTADRATWRWQRRAMAPIFQSRNLRGLAPAMTGAAEATTARIDAAAAAAGTVDVYPEMVAATCDVICDAALSNREVLGRDAITAGVTSYINNIARVSLLDMLGAPRWIPRPGRLRAARGPDLGLLVDRAIETRRRSGSSRPPDLLDALIAARDPETGRAMDAIELRNNLLAFVLAGHETTALALTWSLYLLAFDQDVQVRARTLAQDQLGDRAATAADLDRLAYIRQVIEEALRLYPPAALLRRRAAEEDRIADHAIRPGTLVMLPVFAVHRHALLWEHPSAFDPDRFAPEAVRARHRFGYLPFGAGPRTCIGSSFALMEAQIILASLLARFSFTLPSGFKPRPQMWLTLRPAGGMPLIVERL